MKKRTAFREPLKPLPSVEDLRRAYIDIANNPASTRQPLQALTDKEETTVFKPPPSLDDLRRESIDIANHPAATARDRLRALIIYEKLSGFDKPPKPEGPEEFSPLDDITDAPRDTPR